MRTNIKDNLQNAKEKISAVREDVIKARKAVREDVIKARKCENINDPIDTYIIDSVAMLWSKLFVRLGIIPNVVTLMSMLSGVAGGVLLACEHSIGLDILGVVLVFLSAVFDASDGQVARLTRNFSRLGRILDGLSDACVYCSLYTACVVRLWNPSPLGSAALWHVLIVALGLGVLLLYVIQCQLPDYYKNLHMYMIDNSHGNELSRSRHARAEFERAPQGTFERFSLKNYYRYTLMQEKRAPRCQEMLDAIEQNGKNDELCDAFYDKSRTLVKLTNLLTFNLRTIVLLLCALLHQEIIGLLFVAVVLEPIRLLLLSRYEKLCASVRPLIR